MHWEMFFLSTRRSEFNTSSQKNLGGGEFVIFCFGLFCLIWQFESVYETVTENTVKYYFYISQNKTCAAPGSTCVTSFCILLHSISWGDCMQNTCDMSFWRTSNLLWVSRTHHPLPANHKNYYYVCIYVSKN